MAKLLIATSSLGYGTLQLSSGDVQFFEGEATIVNEDQIKEYLALVESGRVPHLGVKSTEELEAEVAEAQAKAAYLAARLEAARKAEEEKVAPVVGATSSIHLPKAASKDKE